MILFNSKEILKIIEGLPSVLEVERNSRNVLLEVKIRHNEEETTNKCY